MKPALPLIATVLLGACTATGHGAATGCHGPRRPANPHGSVLSEDSVLPAHGAVGSPAPARAPGGCGGVAR